MNAGKTARVVWVFPTEPRKTDSTPPSACRPRVGSSPSIRLAFPGMPVCPGGWRTDGATNEWKERFCLITSS